MLLKTPQDSQIFEGWTAGALWEGTHFAARHYRDIERRAVVGEAKSEKGMTAFIKPFTAAEVKHFDRKEADRAHERLRR